MQSDSKIKEALDLLGLKGGASEEELKRAFRKFAKIHHPDRYSGDPHLQQLAAERFRQINQAYELIKAHLAAGGKSSFDSDAIKAGGPSPSADGPGGLKPPATAPATQKGASTLSGVFRQTLARFISNAAGVSPAARSANVKDSPQEPTKSRGPLRQKNVKPQSVYAPRQDRNRKKSVRIQHPGPIRPIAPVKRVDQV